MQNNGQKLIQLLTIDEVAGLAKLSRSSIEKPEQRRRLAMPPDIRLGGSVRFDARQINQWLTGKKWQQQPGAEAGTSAPRRRGRPTKREQFERALAAQLAAQLAARNAY